MDYINISPKELKDLLIDNNIILIDVRTDEEWDQGYLKNANHIPLSTIDFKKVVELCEENIKKNQLDVSQPICLVFYCKAGTRSIAAIEKIIDDEAYDNINQLGFNLKFYNLKGGILKYNMFN